MMMKKKMMMITMNTMEMATNLLKRKTAPGNGISPGLPSDGGDGDEVDDGDVQIGIGENIAMQV